MSWFVYVLRCRDGSLYVGITNDLVGRTIEHNRGKGATFTRGRRPVALVWWEEFASKSEARKREIEIKSWSKSKKEMLVGGFPQPTASG
ncbi:MAG: GIY-YIG nuclease family protein [Candidatus Edwardsbacteria bacterium]